MNAKYRLIVAAIASSFLITGCSGEPTSEYAKHDIDLGKVLDITVDSLYKFQDNIDAKLPAKSEQAEAVKSEAMSAAATAEQDKVIAEFAGTLVSDYNSASPALHSKKIGVIAQKDASLLAFEDANKNNIKDEGEKSLYLIEIDGEKSRIIASTEGSVQDHSFSGTGLLAGMLVGALLGRQLSSGADRRGLANKTTGNTADSARSRSGSGSHTTGK